LLSTFTAGLDYSDGLGITTALLRRWNHEQGMEQASESSTRQRLSHWRSGSLCGCMSLNAAQQSNARQHHGSTNGHGQEKPWVLGEV
jgi:hypothetical protein